MTEAETLDYSYIVYTRTRDIDYLLNATFSPDIPDDVWTEVKKYFSDSYDLYDFIFRFNEYTILGHIGDLSSFPDEIDSKGLFRDINRITRYMICLVSKTTEADFGVSSTYLDQRFYELVQKIWFEDPNNNPDSAITLDWNQCPARNITIIGEENGLPFDITASLDLNSDSDKKEITESKHASRILKLIARIFRKCK